MSEPTYTEWRPVVGYEGIYEVSPAGQVRSVPRRGKTRGMILKPKPRKQRSGHLLLNLRRDGVMKTKTVHRIVAAAFLGPCPDGLQVRHVDGDPTNNAVTNLAYGTSSENRLDSVRHGTHNHARKTTCKNGHPFDGHNGRNRTCSICQKRTQNASYQRRKKEA